MQKMNSIYEFAATRPIFTGVVGTISGWFGAIITWIDSSANFEAAHKLLIILGSLFGTIAAFFTMLVVINNFISGNVKRKLLSIRLSKKKKEETNP
jgi:hypothetical protein